MNQISTTAKSQTPKPNSGKPGEKKARTVSDDRQEVGLIAAIMVVLSLGVLGYWIAEEGGNTPSETQRVAATGTSKDWEGSQASESRDPESRVSLIQTVSAETGDMPASTQTSTPIPESLDVHFEFNQHRLTDEIQSQVREDVAKRGNLSGWTVSVEGHADRIGSEPFNQALGLQRAQSIQQFLVELGVQEESIVVSSMGELAPLCHEKNDDCDQKNRRAHLVWSESTLVTQTPTVSPNTRQPNQDQALKLATASHGEQDTEQESLSALASEVTP